MQPHTPRIYGIQSYISVPIFLDDGSFWGTLCAIDPEPAKLKNPMVVGMFRMFADLIAFHLQAGRRVASVEADLAEAKALIELRDRFVAVLGHDLRNPAAAIVAGAKMLSRGQLDERQRTISEAIGRSAAHMTAVINDILDMTRIRLGGSIILKLEREGLEPALRHAVDELRLVHPGREIDFSVTLLRPVEVDATYMSRLLSNLVKNALTYGSEIEPVRVTVSSNAEFVLSVSNKGKPVPDEIKKRLFLPFTRGTDHTDRQGFGLGLYIVSEIARAHGGTVEVESTDDGTTFTFRMPIDK